MDISRVLYIDTTGKGIPNQVMITACPISAMREQDIPSTHSLVESYEYQGGTLSRNKGFGVDPLDGARLTMREDLFGQKYSLQSIFHS